MQNTKKCFWSELFITVLGQKLFLVLHSYDLLMEVNGNTDSTE